MSKGSHEVTESVITRLCEWRGLNCYLYLFAYSLFFNTSAGTSLFSLPTSRKLITR